MGWATAIAALFALSFAATTASAQESPANSAAVAQGTLRVHVRGAAQVQAVATMEDDRFVLRGELSDDVGAPVAKQEITLDATSANGGRAALPPPVPCAPGGRSTVKITGDREYGVETDEHGAFCLRGSALPTGTSLRVRFAGSPLYEKSETTVSLDPQAAPQARAVVRFESPLEAIDLDRETVLVTASLRIDRGESGRPPVDSTVKREGLPLVLEDERGASIAEAITDGEGRARFEIKTEKLPPPGEGELRLRFDGTPTLAKGSASQTIVRRAEVKLTVTHVPETNDPEEGVPIDVDVTSSRGAVTSGLVEALQEGDSVGAGSVEGGHARVIAAFTLRRSATVPLTLRYVADAPWWKVGSEIPVEVRVAGPGVWRMGVVAAVVIAIAVWIGVGWRRAPKSAELLGDLDPASSPPGRAGVQVVRTVPGITGWRGIVMDAHDGAPVAGAVLAIHIPSFDGNGIAAYATADAQGSFELEGPARSDARLVVESADHSRYEQALPPPSVISVALVTRRRTIVDRLVRWARRQGAPFDGPPEPTPGHVRRVAARGDAEAIEAWARRVENAAFGPDLVDDQVERHVCSAEPNAPPPLSSPVRPPPE